MDFDLTQEQHMVQDMSRDFARNELEPLAEEKSPGFADEDQPPKS